MIKKALAVIVWENRDIRKVLLLQVTEERGGGWHPVTGHVEPEESFEAAALREATEETGFSFTVSPRYLGIEHEFDGRFGHAMERAYALIVSGDTPPTPKLDATEHTNFQWLSPAEAMQAAAYPTSHEAIYRATHPLAPLELSSEGVWSQDGEEITHERTRALLYNSVKRNADGTYRVETGGDQLRVVVADTAFFISSYEPETGLVTLLGGKREVLRPETLEFIPGNACYAKLQNSERAKFLRSAYYTLAQQVDEEDSSDGKKYFLKFLGRRHELRVPH
jgi:8-oxo-dGTP pyrophosphatase MutT (NUDIX family)